MAPRGSTPADRTDAPLPPQWLHERKLPIFTLRTGTPIHRVYRKILSPLHFGRDGGNRFDAPNGEFGVLYAGRTLDVSFVETLLRIPNLRGVDYNVIQSRRWCTLEATRPLRLVRLHGPYLSRLGTTAGVCTGRYEISQAWALALHEHKEAPDGIQYLSRHDPSQLCVALFDRCGSAIKAGPENEFDQRWLTSILKRYGKDLF
jgi:hypothetical protein